MYGSRHETLFEEDEPPEEILEFDKEEDMFDT